MNKNISFWKGALVLFALISVALPSLTEAQTTTRSSWRARMANTTEGANNETIILQNEASNWRKQSSETETAIQALGTTRAESFPIPVLFGISRGDVTPDFGDPRDGGTRSHEGQDLISKTGVPIVSPTDAVVTNVGNGASSGYFVYTANPGGETFVYMHLNEPSALVRGQKIARGDLIGFVGSTGNAAGGVAHLHFEVRKDGAATDPYPRLTGVFTSAEKINFLSNILNKSSDSGALARLLVGYFSSDLRAIQTEGITLPDVIQSALQNAPATPIAGDLTIGSRGASVIDLQNYLINSNKGPAARTLAGAGATGNFGSITQNALIEFQTAVGLNTTGIYDTTTKSYVAQHPASNPTPVSTGSVTATSGGVSGDPVPTIPSNNSSYSGTKPTRDLTIGSRGDDVIWLQNFLISARKGVAAQALDNAGATGYFGTITRNAVVEYQASVGISPASGYFGPLTRGYFKSVGAL